METISIGAAEHIDQIRDRLDSEFRFLEQEGFQVRISESSKGNIRFLGCGVREPDRQNRKLKDGVVLFRHYIANALSDVIVNEWEDTLLRKIIRTNYYYFNKEEQDTILSYAEKYLKSPEDGDKGLIHRVNRKSNILHKLLDYLDIHNELVLEGFVTFRLKEYVEELEDAVDRAVDDFLMEREYNEFIRLLKYFVEVQEPKVEEVNVHIKPSGTFQLFDGQHRAIDDDCLEDFIVEMVESETNYEDLLISALITIAPKRVVVHCSKDKLGDESIQTIGNVFGDRVKLCHGCPACTGEMIAGALKAKGNKQP